MENEVPHEDLSGALGLSNLSACIQQEKYFVCFKTVVNRKFQQCWLHTLMTVSHSQNKLWLVGPQQGNAVLWTEGQRQKAALSAGVSTGFHLAAELPLRVREGKKFLSFLFPF